MGWKTFRSHFQINHHIVQVAPDNPGRLHIGYLGNLIEQGRRASSDYSA